MSFSVMQIPISKLSNASWFAVVRPLSCQHPPHTLSSLRGLSSLTCWSRRDSKSQSRDQSYFSMKEINV